MSGYCAFCQVWHSGSCCHPGFVTRTTAGPVFATFIPPPLDRNVEAVRQKLADRAALGFAKYGVTTERTDLDHKAWLRHLQEELLDAAVYIEAALKGVGDG